MRKDGKPATASQRLIEFIQNNRRVISAAVIALVVGAVVCLAVLIAADISRGRAIAAVEELQARHLALASVIDAAASAEPAAEAVPFAEDGEEEETADGEGESELDAFLAELEAFAARGRGYARARANFLLADVRGRLGDRAAAEAAWLAAARAHPRSYMAPIALFNAGVSAEEQGEIERAMEHYLASLAAPYGFHGAPRAQFAIGRLWEALGDPDAAVEAYNEISFLWPQEATLIGMARSRVVAIATTGMRLAEPVERDAVEADPVPWMFDQPMMIDDWDSFQAMDFDWGEGIVWEDPPVPADAE